MGVGLPSYSHHIMEYGFWHTFNRGVEKRKTFLDQEDYFRGVHDIYEFNDKNIVINVRRRFLVNDKSTDGSRTPITSASVVSIPGIAGKARDSLIDLFSWSFMPNHYHLFSSPKNENGLAKFHQKFGTGYSNYFNLKYKRSGVLFQGGYKKVQVKNDPQTGHLICYIHSNLLELWKPNWKEKGLTELEIQNALKFLLDKKNRWSSHQDYWGIKNFPSLINTDFLVNFFGGSEGYRKFFIDWLKQYQSNVKDLREVIIE